MEKLSNRFTARPRVLMDACLNFLTAQEEVTMSVSSNRFLMKNYVDGGGSGGDDGGTGVRTEMTMTAGQFEDYAMPTDTTVTYCLKELRAIINFADTVAEPISACFSTAGE